MKQTRINWLVLLIAALAIANIALLATIWLRQKEPSNALPAIKEGQGDARSILVRELQMDSLQTRRFDTLRQVHFSQMKSLREEMRGAKDALFESLHGPATDAEAAAQWIGVLQAKMDLNTYQHFAALRQMLRPDQQDRFDRVIGEVLRSMAPDRKGPHPGDHPQDSRGGQPNGPPEDGPPPPPEH